MLTITIKTTLIFFFYILLSGSAADDPFIRIEDFIKLTSSKWTGSLTYTDYSSGKSVTIPAEVSIAQSDEKPSLFIFNFSYPEEPHANSVDSVLISEDGKSIGNERIIQRFNEDSKTVIVTTRDNSENGKEFTYRYTYRFNPRYLYIGKEECEKGSESFLQRNYFEFNR